MTVLYQGSQSESFRLGAPSSDNEDVCCRPGSPKRGPLPEVPCRSAEAMFDGGPVEAVLCELWTNGVAEVRVSSGEYPTLDEVLEPREREDECGLETKDVRLVLDQPDGGVDD